MKIEIAPSDGIEKYEAEMNVIYKALQEVTGEDFSGALVTDESYITDFLSADRLCRQQEYRKLESILGIPLDNPGLVYLCRMIQTKAST